MKPDYKKIVQTLSYLARKASGGAISKLHALKLVYLADRYHLRKYGRTITGDTYYAMRYGPVPSLTKSIIDRSESVSKKVSSYTEGELIFNKKGLNRVIISSSGSTDTSELSETDKQALDKACEQFWQVDDIVEFTHKFPEWATHEKQLQTPGCTRFKMRLTDFFLTAPVSVEYCEADAHLIEINRSYFTDVSQGVGAL